MAGRPTTDDFTARARLFGGNRMKLGVMAFNCSHGSTITTVPEAWKLDWADTVAIAQAVDQSGMEALLPVGRWRGYGGPSDFNSTTFESFTWASALGALTKYITVLATCHVPLVHPLMVAKMSSTVDPLGVPVDELTTEPSTVVHTKSGRRLSYGEIAATAQVPAKSPDIKPKRLPSQTRSIRFAISTWADSIAFAILIKGLVISHQREYCWGVQHLSLPPAIVAPV